MHRQLKCEKVLCRRDDGCLKAVSGVSRHNPTLLLPVFIVRFLDFSHLHSVNCTFSCKVVHAGW